MKGTEMFTTDEQGRKVDAPLHRQMLANIEADRKAQTQSARFARSLGISNELIARVYPLAN